MVSSESISKKSDTFDFHSIQSSLSQIIHKSSIDDTVEIDLNKLSSLKEGNNLFLHYQTITNELKDYQKQAKIINFDIKDKLSEIGQDKIDEIVSFEATIKRIPNNTDPLLIGATFECYCLKNKYVTGDYFKPPKPPFCSECGKSMNASILDKLYTDMKIITVEEPPEEFITANSQPRTLNCLLKGDLARNDPVINPGDKVKILGILRIKELKVNRKTKEVYLLDVLGIENIDNNFNNLVLTDEEINEIKSLNHNRNMYEVLTRAILKNTVGHEYIKKAILCQLFSHSSGNKRGNIHILIAGDPGLNKSQILLRIKNLVPKSSYCVGGSMTIGGLIGIVNRDEFTGQWAAEAGLITKCHKGLLCIDEIDKLPRDALGKFNEALEQQQATITKANLNVTYPAETTVLCAMNPKKGHFDMYDDINKQLNIPDSFKDRFDLIFIMQDIVDPKNDILILNSVINGNNSNEILSDEIILKYISYAKQEFPDPIMEEESQRTLANYYTKLRNDPDPLKIHNARDIEAIVRLSKSLARINLRNQVIFSDVEEAINIYQASLNSLILKERVGQHIETIEDSLDVF